MSANFIWFWRSASIVVVCMVVGWCALRDCQVAVKVLEIELQIGSSSHSGLEKATE